MMYTEEKAKHRLCPLLQEATGNDCRASYCMMWRWNNDEEGCIKADQNGNPRYEGFCGLAGKPAGK